MEEEENETRESRRHFRCWFLRPILPCISQWKSYTPPPSPPTGAPGPTTENGNADAPPANLIDLHSPPLMPGENISEMMATMDLHCNCTIIISYLFLRMYISKEFNSYTIDQLQRFAWRCKGYTVVSWASTHSQVCAHVPHFKGSM